MGRRLPTTPRSKVRAALRQLWLRSRERAQALKRENYTCEVCHVKQSAAKGREVKLEVHHTSGQGGIEWDRIIDYIFRNLLVSPDKLAVLCKSCHLAQHEAEKTATQK